MNIFQNIAISRLLLLPFYREDHSGISIVIDIVKWHGSDPVYVNYEPFKFGYEMEFTVTSTTDVTYIIPEGVYMKVVSDELNLQIGSEEGFKLVSVVPPAAPGTCIYTYTFKTVKPNRYQFIEL